jgi:hypothetical protein
MIDSLKELDFFCTFILGVHDFEKELHFCRVKHTFTMWGETLRPPHALNCVEMESFDPFFQEYVHKHIERIVRHNPLVFRRDLDPNLPSWPPCPQQGKTPHHHS